MNVFEIFLHNAVVISSILVISLNLNEIKDNFIYCDIIFKHASIAIISLILLIWELITYWNAMILSLDYIIIVIIVYAIEKRRNKI